MTLVGRIASRLVRFGATRPRAALIGALVLALAGALALTRLDTDTGARTLVGTGSESFAATERAQDKFGSDAVLVRVAGPVKNLVLTSDLDRILGLEGCLAGHQGQAGGPCARLAGLQPAQAVIGPGTFINTSASQISDEYARRIAAARRDARRAARAARTLARDRGLSDAEGERLAKAASEAAQQQALLELAQIGLRFGILKPPTINDQNFVAQLVFAGGKEAGTPKQRFAYLFPDKNTALISVRLRSGLSEQERAQAIDEIRAAIEMPQWKLENGGRYAVTGAPVVLSDLTGAVSEALLVLSLIAIVVMALTLALVFPVERRLTPLAVALGAAAVTFGLLSLVGASLTIAAVAVAPILLGLVVDYALQIQSQFAEQGPAEVAGTVADRVGTGGATTIAIAALTTACGFVVLVLSPVPMVRQFGLLLVAGVLVGLVAALVVVPAVVSLPSARHRRLPGSGTFAGSARGAAEIVRESRAARTLVRAGASLRMRAFQAAGNRPQRLLAIGAVIAALGLAADGLVPVESDVIRLAPQGLDSLQQLRALQESSGIGGQIDLLVEGRKVTDPAVVRWMSRYQQQVLRDAGYNAKRGCGEADLCPAFSLPDLLAGFAKPTQKQIEALLKVIPSSFSQSVITADRRSATVAFGIRLMPLSEQSEVIERMRDQLDPPKGVQATLVGLPVLAADANAAIASPLRRILTLLAGLLVVAVALRLLLGSWRRSLVPIVPIALAAGWAPLLLLASRVPLNAMSVTLSALVIAIATEFSVLLSERHRRERLAGRSFADALTETYRTTGVAILASGATAIAGFAVLITSQIRMLRDFGLATVLNLGVALAAVLLVLPAALAVFGERGEPADER